MLELLKKTGSTGNKDTDSPWRADFRDLESLPDTKTVRTSFLISMIVFTLLGSLALFTVHREITLSGLKEEITLVQSQIVAAGGANAAAEAQYKLFQAEEKTVKDVQAWAVSEFSFPDYLIHLASLMPAGVKSTRIEFRGVEQSILVTGFVEGQDATASETATQFISALQEDEKMKAIFSSVKNSNLGRDAAAGTLNFELVFTFSKPGVVKK